MIKDQENSENSAKYVTEVTFYWLLLVTHTFLAYKKRV